MHGPLNVKFRLVEYPLSYSYVDAVIIIWRKVWVIRIETPDCVFLGCIECSVVIDCQVTAHFNCIGVEINNLISSVALNRLHAIWHKESRINENSTYVLSCNTKF